MEWTIDDFSRSWLGCQYVLLVAFWYAVHFVVDSVGRLKKWTGVWFGD